MHFDKHRIALSFDIKNSSEVTQTRRGTLRDPNNQRVSLAHAVRCSRAINYYKLMWLSPPLLIGMIIKLGSAQGTYATLPKIIRTETNRRSSLLVFTSPQMLVPYFILQSHTATHTNMQNVFYMIFRWKSTHRQHIQAHLIKCFLDSLEGGRPTLNWQTTSNQLNLNHTSC